MLSSEVITKFETYVDDATELSSSEELNLLQKIFDKVWVERPWEFAKAAATGTLSASVPYVSLPADFGFLSENNQTTDNSVGIDNNAAPKVVYVGSSYTPYQVVNWSDRRKYLNQSGYCYIDIPNARLVFTAQPLSADSYEFDYIKRPPTLVLTDEIPSIPSEYHPILYHGMAVDDDIILRYPKAQSYAPENQAQYEAYMRRMAYWNGNLQLN
jgi:hypothetical protein